MLIRLTGQTGQFDLIPSEFTVTDGTRVIFADVTSASQFLAQFRNDSLAMGRLEKLHNHIRPVGSVKRDFDEATLFKQLAPALTGLSGGRITVIEREQDEAQPRWWGADALSTALKPVAPISRPITARERQRWEETFNTNPVPKQKYKIVIEVAGKHLEPLDGHLAIRRTPEEDDYGRQVRFKRDTGRDAHRVVLCFDNVPNKPRQLHYVIGTCHIPLCMNVTPVAREAEARQWENVLIPIIPVCRYNILGSDGVKPTTLPPGWLYVYVNGHLWREVQVCNDPNVVLCDVNLAAHPAMHRKDNQRPADGQLFNLLLVPHKLNGVTQTVQLAYSRQPWNWTQLCQAGGINPDDPRFTPTLKQRSASTPADSDFQRAHLATLDLSGYDQGFEATTDNPAASHTISPVSTAPKVMFDDAPRPAIDLLTKHRHLNIPVVTLTVSPPEPLVIAYLEADGQQGIQTHYRLTSEDNITHEGQLDAQGQAVLHRLPEGAVSIEFGDPTPLKDLQDQRDTLRQELRSALHAMIVEVEASAVHQNRQLAEEGLINTGLIYTGAYITGLYNRGKSLVNDVRELVATASGTVLVIQLANLQAMNALMKGDIEAAKQAYGPLAAKGVAAAKATEATFETLGLLLGDAKTREMLLDFPKTYLGAHTSVEQTRMAGSLSFDILLVLAGAGVGASLVGLNSAGHLAKTTQLFSQLANILKAIKLKKTVRGHTDQKRIEARVEVEKRATQRRGGSYNEDDKNENIALKRAPEFTNLRQMDQRYIGEETGVVWGSKVAYLDETERKEYQLHIKDGKLFDADGDLFDTSNAESIFEGGGGNAIFVMDEYGSIYASKIHFRGKFHHSSFLAGQPVASAGEIVVENGIVKKITRRSGHYQPTLKQSEQFIKKLNDNGVIMDKIEITGGF